MLSWRRIRIIFLSITLILVASSHASAQQSVQTKAKSQAVVLTFDDGPSPKYTPQILDVLDHYHVKAVFFVMGGYAKKYPEILKEIQRRGHVIANHTMNHPMLTKLSNGEVKSQIEKTNYWVKQAIGVVPVCVRPPFGMTNKRVKAVIKSMGMHQIMWCLNSFDYERKGAAVLTKWVVSNSHSGCNILMHDGGNARSQTVKSLPQIIEGLQRKGLGFDVICQSPGNGA